MYQVCSCNFDKSCPIHGQPMESKTYTTNNVSSIPIPYECPVCEGRGFVPAHFYLNSAYYAGDNMAAVTCKTCDGRGVIWK